MTKLTRRAFLKLGAAGAITASLGPKALEAMELRLGGGSHNYIKEAHRKSVPYITSDARLKNASFAFVEDGVIAQVGGNPDHIGTRGRLSPQENAAYLQLYDPERIFYPLRRTGPRGSGSWKRITWDEATKEISERIKLELETGSPQGIVLNMGKGPIDGAWERFMHTLGTGSIFQTTIGDLSKRVGMVHTWGADIEAPDFANARYILIFGSNPFETFQPYAQLISDGRVENRAKLVTFDVRVSMTSGLSDEWFPILPGTDGLVALAMANVIMERGLADTGFIDTWTNYPSRKLAEYLRQFTPELAEKESGVPQKDIKRLAIEFATSRPATVFTYRGVSSHIYGAYQERACMLLPIITGNVEVRGGYCLPRTIPWQRPEPIPTVPKDKSYRPQVYPLGSSIPAFAGTPGVLPKGRVSPLLPFWIKDGRQKIGILFNYASNPAYSAPAASFFREVLKDEGIVPFIVDFSPYMGETAELADIILPDAHYLERNEPDTSPSLWPWVGIRQPVVKPPGEVREAWVVLKDIIERLDPDGKRGMKKYWGFKDAGEWMKGQIDNIPGLKEKGGYTYLKKKGVWPPYGTLDPRTKKVVDSNGNPVEAEYGIHKPVPASLKQGKKGFETPSRRIELYSKGFERQGLEPLPTWRQVPWHKELKKGEFILTTFKWGYHTGSTTANNKFLGELVHSNPVWINKKAAMERGIKDGDLVRVTSPVGYIVTKARVTNSIHPRVAAISAALGHWAIGRVAQARPEAPPPAWAEGSDPDIKHNLWWEDRGVHPNDIIPVSPDPVGGGQGWGDTIVTVTPAEPSDRYGEVKVDNSRHFAFYLELSQKI